MATTYRFLPFSRTEAWRLSAWKFWSQFWGFLLCRWSVENYKCQRLNTNFLRKLGRGAIAFTLLVSTSACNLQERLATPACSTPEFFESINPQERLTNQSKLTVDGVGPTWSRICWRGIGCWCLFLNHLNIVDIASLVIETLTPLILAATGR